MKAAAEYGKKVGKNNMANFRQIEVREEFKGADKFQKMVESIGKFGYFFRVAQSAENISDLF